MNEGRTSEDRWKQLKSRVDEDGLTHDYQVETRVMFPMALRAPDQFDYDVDRENAFIAFIMDDGGTDIEVRLPFEAVRKMAAMIG